MKNSVKNWILIALALIIAGMPMFLLGGAEFEGTDAGAETVVAEQAPDYEPWFHPLAELPPEVESGLFALQAAIGAGIVGYVMGVYRGRKIRESDRASSLG